MFFYDGGGDDDDVDAIWDNAEEDCSVSLNKPLIHRAAHLHRLGLVRPGTGAEDFHLYSKVLFFFVLFFVACMI